MVYNQIKNMNEGTLTDKIKSNFSETGRILKAIAGAETKKIIEAGKMMADAFNRGGKVLVCGNGGSAADAQHFVAEFIGRFYEERESLPAIALSVDPSVVTALGNDYGFASVFSGQVEGLGRTGDILVAISTSGKSANILQAIETAKTKKMKVIVLVGAYIDDKIRSSDLVFSVPSGDTPRIQEVHMAILHSICEATEKLNDNLKHGQDSKNR